MKSLILGMTIASSLLLGAVGEAAENEGLVLYLPFDEGSGDTVRDLSDSGNDGIINGAEWVKDGRIGATLSFDVGDHR